MNRYGAVFSVHLDRKLGATMCGRVAFSKDGITRVEVEEKKQGKIKTEEGKMRDISLLVLGITTIDTSR